jgi:hypothetical protein
MKQIFYLDVQNVEDLVCLSDALWSFVFRGHACSTWTLTTSLERRLAEAVSHKFPFNKEHWLLHEFRRRAQLYLDRLPESDVPFGWLALMQHHGCPTRLLDFTESLFVALYFAITDATDHAAIWAVNRIDLRNSATAALNVQLPAGSLSDSCNEALIEATSPYIGERQRPRHVPSCVIPLEPTILSTRMSRQQGVFLMPLDINRTFGDNLRESGPTDDADWTDLPAVTLPQLLESNGMHLPPQQLPFAVKIVIPRRMHFRGREMLRRMNITAETLFGDADGLAKSLVETVIRG